MQILRSLTVSLAFPFCTCALALQPGDIVVSDQQRDTLIRVDPASGAQTLLVPAGTLNGGAIAYADGELYVATSGGPSLAAGIYRWDSTTGSLISVGLTGAIPVFPVAMIASGGELLVADHSADAVYAVDTSTWVSTVIPSSGLLDGPRSLAVESTGDLLVANLFNSGTLVRIDRGAGTAAVLSSSPSLANSSGVVVNDSDEIFVLATNNGLLQIDPNVAPGANATLLCASTWSSATELMFDGDGNFLVLENTATMPDELLEVDPGTCAANTITAFPTAPDTATYSPIDMAIVAEPNQPPVANAGQDQAIRAGETVYLDGTGSFDDNTSSSALLYSWSFVLKPGASTAALTDANTATPNFVVDVAGTYVVDLIVTDEGGLASGPAEVTISSDNLAPTSDAGPDQLVLVGSDVDLDGSASTDPEDDVLAYAWVIDAAPAGSSAVLDDPASALPRFFADLVGGYTVTLTVSDAIGPGTPDVVQITSANPDEYASSLIVDADDTVGSLTGAEVTNQGNRNALLNFLNQAVVALQDDDPAKAIDKLEKAIKRTDGCALRGSVDGNGPGRDWITTCAAQESIYDLLTEALDAISP